MGEGEEALNLTWEKKPEGCVEGSRVTDAVGAVEWGWRMKSEGGGNNFG
jgi:hypothetical protein